MIRTDVPMIDVFNCLVGSQKMPILSVSGEPYNPFLGRIGVQADAEIVVFGGLGLIIDDAAREHFTRLTGLLKNLDYADARSPEHAALLARIEALSASAP